MSLEGFPELITRLPEAEIPFPGVRGWISQAKDHQIVFLDIDAVGEVSPHCHGEQWGIVVEGEMELTINGDTRRLCPGNTYHIPAGAMHSSKFISHSKTIDVFQEVDRYKPRVS